MKNNTENRDIAIRVMTIEDIPGAMRLKKIAGWNQTEQDWQQFIKLNPDGCFCAVAGQQIVGTATTVNFQNRVAWISMVLVDPDYRGMGLGSSLMRKCLDFLKNIECVKLDATPAGKQVYVKLGFKEEYQITRMRISDSHLNGTINETDITRITEADIRDIVNLDKLGFGVERQDLLRSYINNPKVKSYKVILDDEIQAFCIVRPGTQTYHIGPLIAISEFQAKALLHNVLLGTFGQNYMIDVLCRHKNLISELATLGFEEERQFSRMYLGNTNIAGKNNLVYAICGPEWG